MTAPTQKYFFEGIQNGKFYEGIIDPSTGAPTALTPVDAGNIPDGTTVYPTSVPDIADHQKYYNDFVQYSKSQTIVANCSDIGFVNIGTPTVTINGFPLLTNQGFSIPGREGEIDVSQYIIQFSGAGQNQLFVIRKCYTN
jgi:hypothetical protein